MAKLHGNKGCYVIKRHICRDSTWISRLRLVSDERGMDPPATSITNPQEKKRVNPDYSYPKKALRRNVG